jgi:hypothetical protein
MASRKNKIQHLLRPAAESWELWRLGGEDKTSLLQTAKTLEEIRQTSNTIFAFPVCALFHVPVWLIRTEQDFLRELVSIQIEKRGLIQGSTDETIFGTDICTKTGTHILCRITVLPKDLYTIQVPTWPEKFDLAARFYPFSGNSVVLWRELEYIAAAFVDDGKPIHFQTLTQNELSSEAIHEIHLLALLLESQGLIKRPSKISFWGEFTDEELKLAQPYFQVIKETLPPPITPRTDLDLTPASIREIKKDRLRQENSKKTTTLAAAAYLVFFLIISAYIGVRYIQKNIISTEITQSADEVERVTKIKNIWKVLEPILDPESSPLEVLYQTARLLPKEGVRFTSFEMDTSTVTIQAEASSFPDASTFTQKVKENPQLSIYSWEDPNPILLPNNKAQFQLLGKSIYAPVDIQ